MNLFLNWPVGAGKQIKDSLSVYFAVALLS